MGKIDDSARLIIKIAYEKMHSKYKVAEIYGIPPFLVDLYLLGHDNGPVWGRQVLRSEISRVQADKEGKKDWKPSEKDKYKGGRN